MYVSNCTYISKLTNKIFYCTYLEDNINKPIDDKNPFQWKC